MRNLRNFFLIAIFVLGVVLTNGTVIAQNGDEEQFPNGFVVRGEFLRFYNSTPDPWLLFGYPISAEMDMNGKRVQYFDRARFELTTNDKGSKISLANLGWTLFDEANVVSSYTPPSATCRSFPKNGYNVCYNFLKFYDANNGPLYFGEPVSNVIQIGGQLVQYFDNARLEWQPNADSDLQIGLTNVGRIAMQKYTGITTNISSGLIGRRPLEATDFTVKAFVQQALVAPGAGNTVFVVVQTPALKPVAGAAVKISVNLKGTTNSFQSQKTNADGIATFSIPSLEVDSKQIVQLQVTVDFNQKTVTATTWYRVWY